MSDRQRALLTLAGGALVALGSLLPWATVSSGFGTVSVNGIEGDGVVTLVFGGVLALIGFLRFGGTATPSPLLTFLVALASLALGVFEYLSIQSRLADNDSEFIRASVGIGLYLVIAGGFVALVSLRGSRTSEATNQTGAPTGPIPGGAAADDATGAIARLADLRDRGAITTEEFEAKKKELLSRV